MPKSLATAKSIGVMSTHELPSNWPEHQDPKFLSAADVDEIHAVASILAAARQYADAFDLFHVEHKYWQEIVRFEWTIDIVTGTATTVDNPTRRMISAAINCTRCCVRGPSADIAYDMLLNAGAVLDKHGLSYGLDMALLDLYRSIIHCGCEDICRRSHVLAYDALRLAACAEHGSFCVISPDIQDRERIFVTRYLERKLRSRHREEDGLHISFLLSLKTKVLDYTHLNDCKEMKMSLRGLLEWSQTIAEKHRRSLNKMGGNLPLSRRSRVSAAWIFYCLCVSSHPSFESLVNEAQTTYCGATCEPGNKSSKLDVVLAYAVISESVACLGGRSGARLLLGKQFGDYLVSAIHAILEEWSLRGAELAATYFSRMDGAPITSRGSQTVPETASNLVTDFIKVALQLRHVPQEVNQKQLNTANLFPYSLLRRNGLGVSRNSVASSIQSSINTIRSSMSWETKRTLGQMIETKKRMRRPFSMLSTLSRETSDSNAMSVDSYGSDDFERVTRMPSSGPMSDVDEDFWLEESEMMQTDAMPIDTIYEETEDVDMIGTAVTV